MGITNHDATKVLLGSSKDSDRVVTPFKSDPASFVAGRAVRLNSSGLLSLASGDGQLIGVSLGADLSDAKSTAVARAGNLIPLQVGMYLVKAQLTFISKVKAAVAIEFLDTGTAGSEAATVTGDAVSGWLISLSMESTASTTTQCKAALDANASALALIETVIASGQGSTAVSAFAEDDIDVSDHVAPGKAVRVSNVSGIAVPSAGTLTGAFFASGMLDGVAADGSIPYPVAYIDMAGGL